jgi:hypothetical protein
MQLSMTRNIIAGMLLLLLLPLVAQASEDKMRVAQQAALEWLALVDQQQYDESWQQAARLFKLKVKQSVWVEQLTGGRTPLGDVKSRTMQNSVYSTSLPGAPDGDYVVIRYKTEFANKTEAFETITSMLDGNNWRVAGYFVR